MRWVKHGYQHVPYAISVWEESEDVSSATESIKKFYEKLFPFRRTVEWVVEKEDMVEIDIKSVEKKGRCFLEYSCTIGI